MLIELNYNSMYLKNFENMVNFSKNAVILVLRINRVQPNLFWPNVVCIGEIWHEMLFDKNSEIYAEFRFAGST